MVTWFRNVQRKRFKLLLFRTPYVTRFTDQSRRVTSFFLRSSRGLILLSYLLIGLFPMSCSIYLWCLKENEVCPLSSFFLPGIEVKLILKSMLRKWDSDCYETTWFLRTCICSRCERFPFTYLMIVVIWILVICFVAVFFVCVPVTCVQSVYIDVYMYLLLHEFCCYLYLWYIFLLKICILHSLYIFICPMKL